MKSGNERQTFYIPCLENVERLDGGGLREDLKPELYLGAQRNEWQNECTLCRVKGIGGEVHLRSVGPVSWFKLLHGWWLSDRMRRIEPEGLRCRNGA
jgi:hypothetical protein